MNKNERKVEGPVDWYMLEKLGEALLKGVETRAEKEKMCGNIIMIGGQVAELLGLRTRYTVEMVHILNMTHYSIVGGGRVLPMAPFTQTSAPFTQKVSAQQLKASISQVAVKPPLFLLSQCEDVAVAQLVEMEKIGGIRLLQTNNTNTVLESTDGLCLDVLKEASVKEERFFMMLKSDGHKLEWVWGDGRVCALDESVWGQVWDGFERPVFTVLAHAQILGLSSEAAQYSLTWTKKRFPEAVAVVEGELIGCALDKVWQADSQLKLPASSL